MYYLFYIQGQHRPIYKDNIDLFSV